MNFHNASPKSGKTQITDLPTFWWNPSKFDSCQKQGIAVEAFYM